ncbi:MAG: Gfo/Idh/MocA family oxidoreductase [Bacteroidota bacterium]
MNILDSALEKLVSENKKIRVAMVGAGFMGRGVALQIVNYTPGIELVAVSNRNIAKARQAYEEAGVEEIKAVDNLKDLEAAIHAGKAAITEDALLLCRAENIEVVVDVTGAVEFGTHVAMECIKHGKHIVSMNAEVDGTIGPILKTYADKAGIVMTNADGDQPGVQMNLYRFVKGIGVKPVLCGNIKGLHDPYRNPTTQEGFAKKWGQNPAMVTSFADGSKISFEQAIVANATGMGVGIRGMYGPEVERGTPVEKIGDQYPLEKLLEGPGIVDYVVGAVPAPGIFIFGTHEHPRMQHYLNLYKLGEGPLYCFYRPYHLCHFEVPNSIGRAVLFNDATLAPMGKPYVDVVATAKIDLKAGQALDGIGHYHTYGLCENSDTTIAENLLPLGLAEGATLKYDIPKDQVLTYDDVILPADSLSAKLRKEQDQVFFKSGQPA